MAELKLRDCLTCLGLRQDFYTFGFIWVPCFQDFFLFLTDFGSTQNNTEIMDVYPYPISIDRGIDLT